MKKILFSIICIALSLDASQKRNHNSIHNEFKKSHGYDSDFLNTLLVQSTNSKVEELRRNYSGTLQDIQKREKKALELVIKDYVKSHNAQLIENIDTITSQASNFGAYALSYTPTSASKVPAFSTAVTTSLFATACYYNLSSSYLYGTIITSIVARCSAYYWNIFQKNRQQKAWKLLQDKFKTQQAGETQAPLSFVNRIGAFGHDVRNSALYKKNKEKSISTLLTKYTSELNEIKKAFTYLDIDGFSNTQQAQEMKNTLMNIRL